MAETVGALAADSASTGEVGAAFRLLRMAAAHAAAATTGSGGGDGGGAEYQGSTGAAAAAAARRVLCVTADAYHRAATAVTAASLAHHQRALAGLEPAGALPALDGEDSFQPAPGGLPVCKELVADPEMNLNYAVQYYLRALRSFPWLAAPGGGSSGGGGGSGGSGGGSGGSADGGDVETAAAARALEAAYTSLGRHLLAAGRYTKAQQHFSQGVELFRSLGAPASTAAMCAPGGLGPRSGLRSRLRLGPPRAYSLVGGQRERSRVLPLAVE